MQKMEGNMHTGTHDVADNGIANLPEDFTPENGLLTPSLKVRRKAVETQYAETLDGFYADSMASV